MNRTHWISSLILVLVLVFSLSFPLHAQPIAPEDEAMSDTGEAEAVETDGEEDVRSTQDGRSSAGRIIPPDEFGKYTPSTPEESDMSKEAIIEKLRADSASMRIRYEERIRQLRSDSQAMRSTIEELRKQVRKLKRGQRDQAQDTESGRDTAPNLRSEDRTRARTDTQPESETSTGDTDRSDKSDTSQEETASSGPDAPLNPNTASLSDLRSVPGLSDRLAERIEWYRREVTPFDNLQDLRRVPGIDRQTFKQIQEYFHEGPY